MCKDIEDRGCFGIGKITRWIRAGQTRSGAARVIANRPALVALGLLAVSLPQPCAAQESIAVGLHAGETFVLKGLSPTGTPQVHFSDNPHSFILECGAPGKCSVIGAEAGHGSIRATLENHKSVAYDITVSALTRPGKPLEPGVAPHPAGDIFANRPGDPGTGPVAPPSRFAAADNSIAGYSGTDAGPEGETSMAAPAPPSRAEASDGVGVLKLGQNPRFNALELPPSGPEPANRHYLPAGTVILTGGSSHIYDFAIPLSRVAIADTVVADVTVINPRQVMVVAHKPGGTTLSVWEEDGQYFERPVRVEQGGPQQVELHVVVAELDRSRLEQQGLDISAALANAGVSLVGLPGDVATPYSPGTNLSATGGAGTLAILPPTGVLPTGGQLIPLLLSNSMTYGFSSTNGQWTTNAMFQILEEHDLAKILAEPMLIAASGEEAKFLSGGEIPIVIAQALNTSIVFKQFGTSVNFVPTVIDDHEIELMVAPEFSQPDYTQGVALFGFTVPAFVTRKAQTLVRMRENQTLILAGLVLETPTSEVVKIPYLGDIPYVGALFKHTYYHQVKTELVMTVTPHIVRPFGSEVRVALPTDRGPMSPEEIRTRPLSQPDASRPRFE
jgi:pilus assembly protein CpaC